MSPSPTCPAFPAAAAIVLLALCQGPAAHAAVSFDDVRFWAGSGANRAALVIDFNDAKAPESLVWGYRWDGTATGEDMFRALVEADPRLYAKRKAFSWGTATFGIGYDTNGNGFGISDGTTFDPQTGLAAGDENQADGATPTDPADHYREGWFSGGFFGYYTSPANPYGGGGEWVSSNVGASGRTLTDGAWDGLSFASGSASTPGEPIAAAAVPEPATGLLALAGVALFTTTTRGRRPRRRVA